jgi:hypothetical protein
LTTAEGGEVAGEAGEGDEGGRATAGWVDFEDRGRDIERGSAGGQKRDFAGEEGQTSAGSLLQIIRDVDTSRARVRRYRLACSY